MSTTHKRILRMPNPWPPHDIVRLIETVAFTAGLAPAAYKLIAFWIDDRKAKKIKVIVGDAEVELQGGVANWKNVERACKEIRKLRRQNADIQMKVNLPANIDHSVTIEQAKAANETGK